MRVRRGVSYLVAAGVLAAPAFATLPSGFSDVLVTTLPGPTALAFTPDARLLIAQQAGIVRVFKNGALVPTPALTIPATKICNNFENGLLGIEKDPDFKTNGWVFLYYTAKRPDAVCVNRVARFIMSGDTINPASQAILIDNIPAPNGNHNGGDLKFGWDRYLYISTGDGGCDYAGDSGCQGNNDASRDQHALIGKILRITNQGAIPDSNPFQGSGTARCNVTGRTDAGKKCQETFASGLRNPFRFAFDPNASGTRFFINDVGGPRWEEIDKGKKGADYAWNLCEGNHDNLNWPGSVNCSAAPYTPPIHEYSHDTGCTAITGGAFVPNGVWPAEYDNSYLYSDYVCNKIFELKPKSGGGFTQTEFASGLGEGGPIAMAFGPYGSGQALYYTTYGNGGEVHRITDNTNVPPTAAVTANPTSGRLPLKVDFDGSGSSDPDAGETVTSYLWDFGDGSTSETTTPTTTHTYTTEGTYTASLQVRNNNGVLSEADTVRIDAGNEAPTPVIELPAADLLYSVGEQITLRGSATDRDENDPLGDDSLEWEVLQHHTAPNHHTHPYLTAQTGNNLTISAPPPEDLESTGSGNHLEVRLTATDSKGLSKTVTREIQPNRVDVSFATNPSGLSLLINGQNFTTPEIGFTLTSWEGYTLNLNTPSTQTLSGETYVFSSWSDGEAKQHSIDTGAEPTTYTATFEACTKSGTSQAETLSGTSGADVICGLGGNDTMEGRGGNDILLGGGGADKVKGGGGADNLDGESGNDALNSLDGISGNDSLDGGAGTDTKVTDPTEKSIVGFP